MAQPVNPHAAQIWSIRRTFAFLAAVLAIGLGTFVPAVVAASAGTGTPMVLCAGGQMQVIFVDADGQPIDHDEQASLKCTMALLSGLAATPAEDPALGIAPVVFEARAEVSTGSVHRLIPPARAPPRPPSTAPPIT